MAGRAGVTESFLSQVERDVTSPSIATVQRIAGALDLSIAQLFADEPTPGRVVRREARRRIAYPGLKAVDEFLTSNMAGRLQVILSTIEPGGGTGEEPYTHDSDEEVVVVLSGTLDLWVADEHYVVEESHVHGTHTGPLFSLHGPSGLRASRPALNRAPTPRAPGLDVFRVLFRRACPPVQTTGRSRPDRATLRAMMPRRLLLLPWISPEYREIVGVVADVRQDNLSSPPPPQIYVPQRQMPWFFSTLLIRLERPGVTSAIQQALQLADPTLPFAPHVRLSTPFALAAEIRMADPALADRQDAVHPAVLRAIARVVEGAGASPDGCEVAVCGEMAGDPEAAVLLIGLGVDELSMGAGSMGAVKRAVAARTRDEMVAIAREAMTMRSAAEVRALLASDA